MDKLRSTNILLLIIVVPLIFFILKELSFIFIPLIFSMFIALIFLPLMRWLQKKKIPKPVSILFVIIIFGGLLKLGSVLVQLSTKEILSADKNLIENIEIKLINLISLIEDFFGIHLEEGRGNTLLHYLQKLNITESFGSTLDFIGDTLTMTLMTVFFAILWLSESINFQKLLNTTILKQKYTSIKVFMRIEKDLMKFIIVKVIISLITGLLFSLTCILFDVSFPVFWGLFAFVINFIQMIGSFISVGTLSLFALVEIDNTGTLLLFILTLTAIQVLMGGIIEPVFMGKSFSINVITILVMLMFWGYLWGVPGLVMSIPITVFIKILLEQFPATKIIANVMSGSGNSLRLNVKKSKLKMDK